MKAKKKLRPSLWADAIPCEDENCVCCHPHTEKQYQEYLKDQEEELSKISEKKWEDVELFKRDGELASLEDVIKWWLRTYEGMEHLMEGGVTSPEAWYTVSTILRRCLMMIQGNKRIVLSAHQKKGGKNERP